MDQVHTGTGGTTRVWQEAENTLCQRPTLTRNRMCRDKWEWECLDYWASLADERIPSSCGAPLSFDTGRRVSPDVEVFGKEMHACHAENKTMLNGLRFILLLWLRVMISVVGPMIASIIQIKSSPPSVTISCQWVGDYFFLFKCFSLYLEEFDGTL